MAELAKRSSVKLTNSRVQALRPEEKVIRVWDSIVAGFHVRITPAGSKSYCIAFQRPSGAKVNVTLGNCGTWDVDTAREKARELRTMHDDGKDARAYVQSERNAQTIQALADLWTQDYRPKLKPSSRPVYDSLLKVVILPTLGKRLVKDLDFASVKSMHRNEAKEHETNANRAVAVLSRLLSIAEKEGWRPRGTNPCRGVEKISEAPRERVLSAEELALLEATLTAQVKENTLNPVAADLIRFLALSGLRRGEALGLMWVDFDDERGTMRFTEHKTSKQGGTKLLPLNEHLRVILKRRAEGKLSTAVFPGFDGNKPLVGISRMWLRIVGPKGCNLPDITPHDLRRTFMSTCVELGYPPAIADTLLGHSLGRIRDTYTRLDPSGILATASQETADWIAAAMAGQKPKVGLKITKDDAVAMG